MKRLLTYIKGDKVIWLIAVLLSLCSLLAVYSSTGTLAYMYNTGTTEFYLMKQLLMIALGLGAMYVAHLINYRYYSRLAQLLLALSIPLLIITLFMGTDINQARRWITLPVIDATFQTSDLAKLALIMYVARGLSKMQNNEQNFYRSFLPIFAPVVVVCGLIAPSDFSTAALLFATCLLLMFIGRVKIKYLMGLVGVMGVLLGLYIGVAALSSSFGRVNTWEERITEYFSEGQDSYQNKQAKIAIASGQVFGKGPGNSSQRNYLPHPYSDFIFAIIVEEYGLVGGMVVLFLYLIFLLRCIKIVIKTPKAFGALLAVGLGFSITIQALINMAVTVDLLPVTGLPLPLVSMGGTSLLFSSLAIGIILSVSRHIEHEREQKQQQTQTSTIADEQMQAKSDVEAKTA
jgi:cell division protein FtsW